ncbi:protein kinase [Nocardiopsis alba]|uniref:protein kinase domain-containing protein n=1 Tax=Nocardiopsis alba TaxID=53437 RepID=UPI0033BE85A3
MAMSAGFPTGEELPERIGHYVIRRRIGAGGMGVVYQAEDPHTDRFVAVKVLKPEVAGDHIARARLAREVETMRRVQSPNVAEVIDADTQAELPWVVTEYIPGPTLDATVTDHGPLRGRALTRFVTGMARAIKDIHAVDVIHRDLKPGNVIISNGEPIVIDFGIAHAVDGAKLTQTGTFVGTPSYLSPEVIEGTDLGPATDVHAWGGTVAFASTGRPPYGAGSFEVIFFRILNGEIDMDGMHEALRPLVNRAVSRDMSARPTAAELVTETGRLNLDLPWSEPQRGLPDQTGGHTVHSPAPGVPDTGGHGSGHGGVGGAILGGAMGGAAAGHLLGGGAGEGWGSAHTRSAPGTTDSAWSTPSNERSGGRESDLEATDDLGAARSNGWSEDPEATDDLSGARSSGDDRTHHAHSSGWDDEATDDLSGAGTERIVPGTGAQGYDTQGTQRIDPVRDDVQGTQRIDPSALAPREDPQGTMMMGQDEISRHAQVQDEDPDGAPQTRFFNSPLDPKAFQDILTPVGAEGRRETTQEFDEEEYRERGGLLGRFRRGGGDRFGDYFRGDREGDEYDEDEDEYYDETWRMHPLVLIPIMLSLAGTALWFPWFGIFLGVVLISGLSALDVVKAEHARRLQTRGRRNSDGMVVALSFPWAFGRMTLRTVGFGLIYLVAGILVGLVYSTMLETGNDGANYTGAFAVFVMILLSYIMPSGREARHQAVWLVERVRFHNLYLYIGVVVAIVLLTMLILSIGLGSAPIWTMGPLTGPADWFG